MVELAIEHPVTAADCFHCGLPVPFGVRYVAKIDGAERPMCCPGCCAVAQAITDAGLADYYRYRTAVAVPQLRQHDVPVAAELQLFDLAEVQQTFVRATDDCVKEAALILENITCAACVWLIEKRIGALPGVRGVEINHATQRARVTWDETHTRLSAILQAIADIGYRAQPYDAVRSDELHRAERRQALWRLFVAGFGSMQVMMVASTVYFADGDMTRDIEMLMRWASLVLTTPVVFYSAGVFFRNAWRDLSAWRVGMDVPVAFAIAIAFAASVWATMSGAGEVYYDSIAMFVFLLLAARYLQSAAQAKAVRAVERLARLAPAIAERVPGFPTTRATEKVAVAQLRAGDHVLVRAGSPIPADGCVVEGASRVDEALLTGESRPVVKSGGDALIGGAVNVTSPLMMRIEHVGQQTVLSAIVRLLDRAMTEKPRITQLADRVAHHFISALLVGAVIVAAIWTLIEPSAALWITVSVLVVACPCALSLATPAAITAATGYLARRGVLITRGHTLETLAHATHFVFDKTGTLTHGRYELLDVKVVRLTVAPMSSESNVLHGRPRLSQRPNTRLRALCAMQRPEAGACMPMTWLITLGPASKGASAIGACVSAVPLSSPSWQAKPRPTYWTEPTTHPSWPWERQAQLKGQAGSLSFRSAIGYAMKRARSFARCLTGARSSLFCPAIVRTSCGVLQESWPSLT